MQGGFKGKWWWKYSAKHYSFVKNIAVVDGDSSYNRKHKNGHFPGESFSFGSQVDFLPTPGTKREGFDEKTMERLLVGYHPSQEVYGLVTTWLPNWNLYFTTSMKHPTRKARSEYTV